MRHASGIAMNLVKRMNHQHFDLSSEGYLVYRDPMIGTLHHPQRGISVRINPRAVALELRVDGSVAASFELPGHVADACVNACGAYFSAYERKCRADAPAVQAA